jgi:hypothetical protein
MYGSCYREESEEEARAAVKKRQYQKSGKITA